MYISMGGSPLGMGPHENPGGKSRPFTFALSKYQVMYTGEEAKAYWFHPRVFYDASQERGI
jgi:hypothetical protein